MEVRPTSPDGDAWEGGSAKGVTHLCESRLKKHMVNGRAGKAKAKTTWRFLPVVFSLYGKASASCPNFPDPAANQVRERFLKRPCGRQRFPV